MTTLAGREEVEIPWWTYGAHGMQLWFPSSLADPVSPSAQSVSRALDPELEFDKEVYPIGISLAEVAIIGACSAHCFEFDFLPFSEQLYCSSLMQDTS